MSLSPSGAITGGPVSGFTSPTYTLSEDTAPDYTKQWTVTALGGTQTGVLVHSLANPFTFTVSRDRVMKTLGAVNPVTGVVSSVPRNGFKLITRKGVIPYTDAAALPAVIRTDIQIPAGADFTDVEAIKALISLHTGLLFDQSSGLADTLVTGTL